MSQRFAHTKPVLAKGEPGSIRQQNDDPLTRQIGVTRMVHVVGDELKYRVKSTVLIHQWDESKLLVMAKVER